MKGIYKDKLEILRQQVPVGLRDGLILLEQANGNLEQAVGLFKQEMLLMVTGKTGVSDDVATKHLIEKNFDIHLALKSIDEERYSITERILRRYPEKGQEVLELLASVVEQESKLNRKFWLDFDDLQMLPQELFCFLAIMEWLNYSDYDGFNYAIYFHADVVTAQIEKKLLLPEISEIILKAKEIRESQFEEQQIKIKKEGGISDTTEFRKQEELFKEQRPLLIDALYEFVRKHIDKFP